MSLLDQAGIDWNVLNRKGETAYQLLNDRNMEWMAFKLKVRRVEEKYSRNNSESLEIEQLGNQLLRDTKLKQVYLNLISIPLS